MNMMRWQLLSYYLFTRTNFFYLLGSNNFLSFNLNSFYIRLAGILMPRMVCFSFILNGQYISSENCLQTGQVYFLAHTNIQSHTPIYTLTYTLPHILLHLDTVSHNPNPLSVFHMQCNTHVYHHIHPYTPSYTPMIYTLTYTYIHIHYSVTTHTLIHTITEPKSTFSLSHTV